MARHETAKRIRKLLTRVHRHASPAHSQDRSSRAAAVSALRLGLLIGISAVALIALAGNTAHAKGLRDQQPVALESDSGPGLVGGLTSTVSHIGRHAGKIVKSTTDAIGTTHSSNSQSSAIKRTRNSEGGSKNGNSVSRQEISRIKESTPGKADTGISVRRIQHSVRSTATHRSGAHKTAPANSILSTGSRAHSQHKIIAAHARTSSTNPETAGNHEAARTAAARAHALTSGASENRHVRQSSPLGGLLQVTAPVVQSVDQVAGSVIGLVPGHADPTEPYTASNAATLRAVAASTRADHGHTPVSTSPLPGASTTRVNTIVDHKPSRGLDVGSLVPGPRSALDLSGLDRVVGPVVEKAAGPTLSTVIGPALDSTVAPVVNSATQAARPVADLSNSVLVPTLTPVVSTAAPELSATRSLLSAVDPVVTTVDHVVAPAVDPVISVVDHETRAAVIPVASAVRPVVSAVDPVVDAAQPVVSSVAPVVSTVEPVVSAVTPVADAAQPVTSAVAPITAAIDPRGSAVGQVVATATPIISTITTPTGSALQPTTPAGTSILPIIATGTAITHITPTMTTPETVGLRPVPGQLVRIAEADTTGAAMHGPFPLQKTAARGHTPVWNVADDHRRGQLHVGPGNVHPDAVSGDLGAGSVPVGAPAAMQSGGGSAGGAVSGSGGSAGAAGTPAPYFNHSRLAQCGMVHPESSDLPAGPVFGPGCSPD
jgi:hypothetical protein